MPSSLKPAYEILREKLEPVGLQQAARQMGLPAKLLARWCSPPPVDSLAKDPLSRLVALIHLTQDSTLLEWLCQRCDGYFVSPGHQPGPGQAGALKALQKVIWGFSALLSRVTDSLAQEGRISAEDAVTIRHIWQNLKAVGEPFVVAVESGRFRPPLSGTSRTKSTD